VSAEVKLQILEGSEFQTVGAAILKPREAKVVRTRRTDRSNSPKRWTDWLTWHAMRPMGSYDRRKQCQYDSDYTGQQWSTSANLRHIRRSGAIHVKCRELYNVIILERSFVDTTVLKHKLSLQSQTYPSSCDFSKFSSWMTECPVLHLVGLGHIALMLLYSLHYW